MSYAADFNALHRETALYIDKILKGSGRFHLKNNQRKSKRPAGRQLLVHGPVGLTHKIAINRRACDGRTGQRAMRRLLSGSHLRRLPRHGAVADMVSVMSVSSMQTRMQAREMIHTWDQQIVGLRRHVEETHHDV